MPRPLVPVYRTRRPNQPIGLYEGHLQITQGEDCIEGSGTIRLEWLPFPRIRFTVSTPGASPFFSAGPAVLNAPAINLFVPGDIHDSSSSSGRAASVRIAGNISHPIRQGSGDALRRLLIHLVNFREFIGTPVVRVTPKSVTSSRDRVVVEAEGWKVTIDAVRGFVQLQKATRAQHGYAITHVATVQRSDGGSVSVEDADDFLTGLHYFLSFARGFWSPGILHVGYDARDHRVWSEWDAWRATPYHDVLCWTDKFHPEALAEAFPGFMTKWTDPIWREAIRLAIHWYIEGNLNAGSLEASIVSTQIALELLSWTYFVIGQQMDEVRFDKKWEASEKIGKFLVALNIPTAVPSQLPSLTALSAAKPSDGPKTFTRVRNSFVHPKSSREFNKHLDEAKVTDIWDLKVEAWRLGLWYLELSLLSLIGFGGVYSNRLRRGGHVGEVESVPWV